MNRRNCKKATTVSPKKNTKKSSTTTPKKKPKTLSKASSKALKSTPNKSVKLTPKKTPKRTRSTRTLPKSPISESMKQTKINDFFKRVSPSVQQMVSTESCSKSPSLPFDVEPNVTLRKKPRKKISSLSAIPFPQTRYSLRNSNNSVKKLKFEDNDNQNDSSIELSSVEKVCLQTSEEVMESNDRKRVSNDTNSDTNLDQMMNRLEINENKKSKNTNRRTKTSSKTNSSDDKINSSINDKKLCENLTKDFDEDMDLIPVFRKPKVPKLKENSNSNSKENINKFVDKEKEKKLNYFLKNLSRIKRDKEMLKIEPIEDIHKELMSQKIEEIEVKPNFLLKIVKGIDFPFSDFISDSIQKYLTEEIQESNVINENFGHLPLNRLQPFLPILIKSESDLEPLFSHIINLVSNEENIMTLNQIQQTLSGLLSEYEFEIHLSLILKEFYKILSRISTNLKTSDSDVNKSFDILFNVIQIISEILSQCSLCIEAIESDEEFIKLLVICFGLSLDHRLIERDDKIFEIKEFIGVLLKHIFIDESKTNKLIQSLISLFGSNQRTIIGFCLQIASLFPIDIEFELKRKFCVSVIKLFVSKDFELNLSGIEDILDEIDWKQLSIEDIYVIIQMIGLSLDLPNDLIQYKETISNILIVLNNKINSSISKASESELNEIHKLLMILKSKVSVSTKRF